MLSFELSCIHHLLSEYFLSLLVSEKDDYRIKVDILQKEVNEIKDRVS